jgi:hypothetical protein
MKTVGVKSQRSFFASNLLPFKGGIRIELWRTAFVAAGNGKIYLLRKKFAFILFAALSIDATLNKGTIDSSRRLTPTHIDRNDSY